MVHRFAYMKNDSIYWNLGVLEWQFLWNCYNTYFFYFSPVWSHLHSLHVDNCDSKSRLVVDENDNGKFRLERVKVLIFFYINHGDQSFFQFEVGLHKWLIYLFLCHLNKHVMIVSTVIKFIFTLTVPGATLDFVCRSQILTSKVDPRAVRANDWNGNLRHHFVVKL